MSFTKISLFFLLSLILFIIRYCIASNQQNKLNGYAEIEGRVVNLSQNSWGKQEFYLNNLKIETNKKYDIEFGDLIIVVGSYQQRAINPLYTEKWLKAQDIKMQQKYDEISVRNRLVSYPIIELRHCLLKLRGWAINQYISVLSHESSALLAGMVLGAGEYIPNSLYNIMKSSGLAHLVVASGSNIALVASVVFSTISFMAKKQRYLVALIVIWCYVILTGLEAPVIRAAIMVNLIWAGQILGRKTSGVWVLGLTAMIMAIINPFIIFSLSFQLSLSATAGLLIFSQPLQIFADIIGEKSSLLGWLATLAVQSVAAQILILPLLLKYFGVTNVMSVIANMAVAWLVTPVVIGGMLLLIITSLLPALNFMISLPLELALRYINLIGKITADMQFANLNFCLNYWGVFLWWMGAFALWWWMRLKLNFKDHEF